MFLFGLMAPAFYSSSASGWTCREHNVHCRSLQSYCIYVLIKNLEYSAPCCFLSPQVWTRKDSPPQPAASTCWLSCFLSSFCSWSVTPSPALRHMKINEDSYSFPDTVVLGTGCFCPLEANLLGARRRCFWMDGSDLIGWLSSLWAWTGSVLLTSTLHWCHGSLTPATNVSHWTSDIPSTGNRCFCSCYSFHLNFNSFFFFFSFLQAKLCIEKVVLWKFSCWISALVF